MRVILASSSSWRRELFRRYFPDLYVSDDVTFLSPDIDEKAVRDDDPRQLPLKVAEAKCDSGVIPKLDGSDYLVITCDQVVLCQGQLREKPVDEAEARRFLRSYSEGAPAECVNGIVVHHGPSGNRITAVESSVVTFRPFPDDVLNAFIASGDPLKTAGAFTVEGAVLGKFVAKVEGSVSSVEGLPIDKLREMMLQLCPHLPCQLPIFGSMKYLLFDMDGLLLDTETSYTIAQDMILERFGIKFTWDVKAMMMGRKAEEAAQIMIDHYKLGGRLTVEGFLREREEILDILFGDADMMPGVERLLLHLHRHGVRMAIATSSHARYYKLKTEKHKDLFKRVFHHVVTGDDVENGKPHPEIFLTALARFGSRDLASMDKSQVLVFEDSPLGIESAVAAKMKSVLVSEMAPKADLGQTLHIPNLLYFLPEQWGLPPF